MHPGVIITRSFPVDNSRFFALRPRLQLYARSSKSFITSSLNMPAIRIMMLLLGILA